MSKEKDRRSVLITAGPTREAIDPVRYITNHSSGKMGYAIAEAFLEKGFTVVLVSGPVTLSLTHPELTTIAVHSADEMYDACRPYFPTVQIAVFAAAVADYKPAEVHTEKMKKSGNELSLQLVKNVDIAFEFGRVKQAGQVSVGFALETNDEEQNALKKLDTKNLDMVILNSVQDQGATFGYDTNKVTIINRDLLGRTFPLKSKKEVGKDIADAAISYANHQHTNQQSLKTNYHDIYTI
ncbi:phosphopantothenoylcysteine decarboxylase domain-containing protein [Mucilaginibacter gotjawali]|uniref:Phosphopantothenoylcysteine decarboxylase/phosphopantothenate--cysteine ligase n=1 Tax=Mucilaginibacter gotjawali TaxID=1550579 RepID=A0A839SAB7_9SPHI|nr:phosphopantothenoylcysteine decarboxylase [Mucilaginibacter gotjawali]MBB3054314.1 phosphopantothenoylcysteine decarboxylase/phosphopantothenate--cysteine ligase [Mucilaginibacter gotjawali]